MFNVTDLSSFLDFARETYLTGPLLLAINAAQFSALGWVLWQRLASHLERFNTPAEVRTLRSIRRAEIWAEQVSPMVVTLMLLGPGIGLGGSTLLGAIGMGALGDLLAMDAAAQADLMVAMGYVYQEIAQAYNIMVLGTPPILVGPVIVLLAAPLNADRTLAAGGSPEELSLAELRRLNENFDNLAALLRRDA